MEYRDKCDFFIASAGGVVADQPYIIGNHFVVALETKAGSRITRAYVERASVR